MPNSPARSTLEVGSVIADTYTLEQLIGRGGMGAVFLASHLRLPGKQVAIKVLHSDVDDEDVLARFRHEAMIASQLNHPNIVGVTDFNTMPDGTPYLVLEYLIGETLAERLRGGPLPLEHALSIMREVGSALAAAHRNGVIHRDLKPQNIFLVRTEIDGRTVEVAKVLDFGISKMRSSQTVKTQDNSLLGTPQYMSPEQAIGQHTKVDERTDVFALGSILYEMLCGHPAFSGASIPEVVFKVVYEQPLRIADEAPTLPSKVTAAIETAMAKTANDRFATVGGFVEALTGEPLALPHASGPHGVVDGPTSSARKAAASSSAVKSAGKPLSADEQIGATQAGVAAPVPGEAGPGAGGSRTALPAISGMERTLAGVGATVAAAAAVDPGGSTVASIAPARQSAGVAPVAAPVTAPARQSAGVAPVTAPVTTPARQSAGVAPVIAPVTAPVIAPGGVAAAVAAPAAAAPVRSRMPIVVGVLAAIAAGGIVYALMRPSAPAHAPPADAASAVVATFKPDAAVAAVPVEPVEPVVPVVPLEQPVDASVTTAALDAAPVHGDAAVVVVVRHDAGAAAVVEPAADEPDNRNVSDAETAYAQGEYKKALVKARAAFFDTGASDYQKARALGIKGAADCHEKADETARTDIQQLGALGHAGKAAGAAKQRIYAACAAAGLPLN